MDLDNFKENLDKDTVFSIENLYEASIKCSKNVGWKSSVISYNTRKTKNILKTKTDIDNESYKLSNSFNEFDVNERGKIRHIKAPKYSERVVQKCLCDNCLVPILTNTLIMNNGACLKGKGVAFSRNRFKRDLERLLLNNKNKEKWILFIDFKKYFDNIDHNILKAELKKYIVDEYIFKLTCDHIDSFGEKGLGLGSQVSQILSVFYCNKLDHYITNYLHIKYYGRYMDDSYIMCNSKEDILRYKDDIEKFCFDKLKIRFSKNKVKIKKIRDEQNTITRLKYIKCTYLVKNNKIIRILGGGGSSHSREKRKLIALKNKLDLGCINEKYIENLYKGWRYAMLSQFDNVRNIALMDNFYISLFGELSFARAIKVKRFYKNDYLRKCGRYEKLMMKLNCEPQPPVQSS